MKNKRHRQPKLSMSPDCWQNDQNINERIDVLVIFQKK